jgi:hypothetical protein
MLVLRETLEEEAEMVVETPTEGDKHLDLDTADILLLDGDEFIAGKKGGIALIVNVFQKTGINMASVLHRKRGENQQGAREKESSAPV